jgi:hypothetical protein
MNSEIENPGLPYLTAPGVFILFRPDGKLSEKRQQGKSKQNSRQSSVIRQ